MQSLKALLHRLLQTANIKVSAMDGFNNTNHYRLVWLFIRVKNIFLKSSTTLKAFCIIRGDMHVLFQVASSKALTFEICSITMACLIASIMACKKKQNEQLSNCHLNMGLKIKKHKQQTKKGPYWCIDEKYQSATLKFISKSHL